jgi:hypothetical protein
MDKISQNDNAAPANLMAECNFRSLKEDELETCFYYEYSRELKSLRLAVGKFTRLHTFGADYGKPSLKTELAQLLGKQSILKRELVQLLAGSAFPRPWQMLSPASKSSLMESLPDAMAELEFRNPLNIIEGDPTQFQNFADFRSQVVEPVGVGVIRVGSFAANLAAGAPMIVRKFERWVRRQLRLARDTRGDELKYFRFRNPGPNGWRTALNQLGAFRWRYHCKKYGLTFREASARPDWKRTKPFYSDQSSLNRACEGATQCFEKLFPGCRPIHFTAGWRD